MRGASPPLPYTPPWCDDRHRGNFNILLYLHAKIQVEVFWVVPGTEVSEDFAAFILRVKVL
jgi:hypothetical protein